MAVGLFSDRFISVLSFQVVDVSDPVHLFSILPPIYCTDVNTLDVATVHDWQFDVWNHNMEELQAVAVFLLMEYVEWRWLWCVRDLRRW